MNDEVFILNEFASLDLFFYLEVDLPDCVLASFKALIGVTGLSNLLELINLF